MLTFSLDTRGSFDALDGTVCRLGLEPTDGHLHLFVNQRRRDRQGRVVRRLGLVRPGKRLEAGFRLPTIETTATHVQVDSAALAAFFAGIDFTAARRGWYRRDPGPLGIDADPRA